MASAIGKSPESDADQNKKQTKLDGVIPDPTAITTGTAEGKARAAGNLPTAEHNKAKDPVIDSMWKAMRPAMRGIEDFCDNYERCAKYVSALPPGLGEHKANTTWLPSALSPTPPYPEHEHRIRLAAVLLPIALLFAFVKVQYMARGATFFMGVAFFSQPYMTKGWRWFVAKYPNWMDFLQVQK